MEKKFGMFTKARKVVFTGQSAGGLGVLLWANYLADRIKNGDLYVIVDSGIFYDSGVINTNVHVYRDLLNNMMKVVNVEIDPPASECIKDNLNSKVNCMFGQNLHKYIKAPMYLIQSTHDSWFLQFDLGIGCVPKDCTGEERRVMEEGKTVLTNVLAEVGSKSGNGVFGIDCWVHGFIEFNLYANANYTIPAYSNWTVAKSVSEWFRNPFLNHTRIDQGPYPTNLGCLW